MTVSIQNHRSSQLENLEQPPAPPRSIDTSSPAREASHVEAYPETHVQTEKQDAPADVANNGTKDAANFSFALLLGNVFQLIGALLSNGNAGDFFKGVSALQKQDTKKGLETLDHAPEPLPTPVKAKEPTSTDEEPPVLDSTNTVDPQEPPTGDKDIDDVVDHAQGEQAIA